MNILEALTLINQGAKVRRPHWDAGDYWSLGSCGDLGQSSNGNWGRLTMVGVKNILATDYEVMEDE